MRTITITRTIDAPIDAVFDTVANSDLWMKAHPQILKIEFLTEQRSGVGARFKETRLMKGKEASAELEIAEFAKNERIRFISDDKRGTIWDTLFTFRSHDRHTHLTMTMDARSNGLMAKALSSLISGMVKKALEQDMDSVKAFCEK